MKSIFEYTKQIILLKIFKKFETKKNHVFDELFVKIFEAPFGLVF